MSNLNATQPNPASAAAQVRPGISHTAAAFAAAAAVAVLLNTLLALATDYFPAFDKAVTQLGGNGWVTQGVAVIAVFFVVGIVLSLRRKKAINGEFKPIFVLFLSVVVAGAGLLAWFYYK